MFYHINYSAYNSKKTLFKYKTYHNNHNRPCKKIRNIQIYFCIIQFLTNRTWGYSDNLCCHSCFPAHPKWKPACREKIRQNHKKRNKNWQISGRYPYQAQNDKRRHRCRFDHRNYRCYQDFHCFWPICQHCQKDSQKHSQKKSCHNTHKTKSNRLPEIPGKTQFKKLSDNRNRRCQKDLLSQIHTCKLPDCNPEKHCHYADSCIASFLYLRIQEVFKFIKYFITQWKNI